VKIEDQKTMLQVIGAFIEKRIANKTAHLELRLAGAEARLAALEEKLKPPLERSLRVAARRDR
jgi:hypothetical protein